MRAFLFLGFNKFLLRGGMNNFVVADGDAWIIVLDDDGGEGGGDNVRDGNANNDNSLSDS